MCGDEGKKTSVKMVEIVIYWGEYRVPDPNGVKLRKRH